MLCAVKGTSTEGCVWSYNPFLTWMTLAPMYLWTTKCVYNSGSGMDRASVNSPLRCCYLY